MSELQARIKRVADEFAKAVVGALRSMTLEQVVQLIGGAPTATPRRTATKRRVRVSKEAPKARSPAKPRRKATNTPALRAARKIQGQYIGHLRKFSPKEKLQIQALAKKKSVAAAVAEMKKRLGRT
jgi:hypothetical protein